LRFNLSIILSGYFHGIPTTYTKVVSDFHETFSVDKALNLKHFDKKIFFKSCCFPKNILKILLAEKCKKWHFWEFWLTVFLKVLLQNRFKSQTQYNIMNPYEKAYLILYKLMFILRKMTENSISAHKTERFLWTTIFLKCRIAQHNAMPRLIAYHLAYNPHSLEFPAFFIRPRNWANIVK